MEPQRLFANATKVPYQMISSNASSRLGLILALIFSNTAYGDPKPNVGVLADKLRNANSHDAVLRTSIQSDEKVLGCDIESDATRIVYLTTKGVYERELDTEKTDKIEMQLTSPAGVRMHANKKWLLIWTPSRFECIERLTGRSIFKLEPSDGDRYAGWAASPQGNCIFLDAEEGKPSIMNISKEQQETILVDFGERDEDNTSPVIAINDRGQCYAICRKPKLLSIFRRDAPENRRFAGFSQEPHSPKGTRFAINKDFASMIGTDVFLGFPSKGDQELIPLVAVAGDFQCFSSQAGYGENSKNVFFASWQRLGQRFVVDRFDLEASKRSVGFTLPFEQPEIVRWSGNGDYIVCHNDHEVAVFESSPMYRNTFTREVTPAVKKLLVDKEYALLDELASFIRFEEGTMFDPSDRLLALVLHYADQLQPESNAEVPANKEDSASGSALDSTPRLLSDWWADRGESPLAALSAAKWHLTKGWSIRGGGFANQVPRQQMLDFIEHLMAARVWFNRIPADAYEGNSLQVGLEIAKGLSDAELKERLLDQVINLLPYGEDALGAAVVMQLPRWGGSVEEVQSFIRDALTGLNEENQDKLYASMILALVPYFELDQLFQDFDVDIERFSRGLENVNVNHSSNSESLIRVYRWLGNHGRYSDLGILVKSHSRQSAVLFGSLKDPTLIGKIYRMLVSQNQIPSP